MREPTVDTRKFADLGRPRRIWAVAAVHSDHERLHALHLALAERFRPGDRIVYLGNMIGRGPSVLATIDELLAFRRAVLAVRGALVGDVVYLRGAQEEMWTKLLQLQFAPNPREVLDWMLKQGAGPTLAAYGASLEQAQTIARSGAVILARWTQTLRSVMLSRPGHEPLFNALRRAAHTATADHTGDEPRGVLLVSAGIDPGRPLGAQADSFWWGHPGFLRLDKPYAGFHRVVRGFDPQHRGTDVTAFTATIDDGCGFGGPLSCACLAPDGEIVDILRV